MTDAIVMLNGYQYARSYYDNNWIYRLSYKVAKIKHSEVVWEPRPVHVCVCVWTTGFYPTRLAAKPPAGWVLRLFWITCVYIYIYMYVCMYVCMYKLCLCALDFLTIGCIRCY